MGRLNNKVAIITGALGGQGQVAVQRFVEEARRKCWRAISRRGRTAMSRR